MGRLPNSHSFAPLSQQAKAAAEEAAAAASAEAEEARAQLAEVQASGEPEAAVEEAVTRLTQLLYFALVRPEPIPSSSDCSPSPVKTWSGIIATMGCYELP